MEVGHTRGELVWRSASAPWLRCSMPPRCFLRLLLGLGGSLLESRGNPALIPPHAALWGLWLCMCGTLKASTFVCELGRESVREDVCLGARVFAYVPKPKTRRALFRRGPPARSSFKAGFSEAPRLIASCVRQCLSDALASHSLGRPRLF